MEIAKTGSTEVDGSQVEHEVAIRELGELELALVGGGHGDVVI